MNIDKQKFMEFVSKAFDEGARITIHFHNCTLSENVAKEKADEFSQIIGLNTEEVHSVDYQNRWYKVDGKHGITVWHSNSYDKKYLKEMLKKLENNEEVLA